jgi:hypothetical protein
MAYVLSNEKARMSPSTCVATPWVPPSRSCRAPPPRARSSEVGLLHQVAPGRQFANMDHTGTGCHHVISRCFPHWVVSHSRPGRRHQMGY